ncbi:MAG TPA: phosphate signaling complex protein PhoU, partial [Acidimicrobiales bacterium]
TDVLLANDLQGAQRLIEDDDELDTLALDIEERCYQVLALQQPVAIDLRSLVTAIRLTSEIERSGDLMVNVAKGARRIYGVQYDPRLRGLIERMSEEATRLFRLCVDAYVEGNAGLAAALDDMDDGLDLLHKDYIQAIFESHHAGVIDLQAAVQLALIGRYYERIGDHAVNIGSRVEYMVTGWLPEHSGAARLQARHERARAEIDAQADAADAAQAAQAAADEPSDGRA